MDYQTLQEHDYRTVHARTGCESHWCMPDENQSTDHRTEWEETELHNCPDCGHELEYATIPAITSVSNGTATGTLHCTDADCSFEAEEIWEIQTTTRS